MAAPVPVEPMLAPVPVQPFTAPVPVEPVAAPIPLEAAAVEPASGAAAQAGVPGRGGAGGAATSAGGGGGRAAESPWALPPQRPAGGGAGPGRRSGGGQPGAGAGTQPAGHPTRPGEAHRPEEGPRQPAGEAYRPEGAVGAAAVPTEAASEPPPGPFPPVMNPPAPLAPTPYPPAAGPDPYTAAAAPVDPYAAAPVDPYTAAAPVNPYAADLYGGASAPVDPYSGGYPATAGGPPGWAAGPEPDPARPDALPPAAAPDPARPEQAQGASGQPGTPGWYPQGWPQGQQPAAQSPYREADGVTRVPPGYPEQGWAPEPGIPPTAEDFARRRQVRPADPVATMGVRAVVNKMGLVRLPPSRHEQDLRRDIEMVRRNFGGLRQVTVVNPKGGAGKTVAILLLAMTFGQKRGGYVLAWDNNETQGTLGMRAQQDFHSRTVRDMLRDLGQFQGAHGRVGDLSQYVRSQGEGMFDVLASDESATGGEMLTASAFAEIREVVSRFYKLIFVDTGNNVRAQNWQAAMDATDQLVVTMSARNDSAETAARMLDHLEQSGRQRLVRQAVTVVSMPPSRKEIDLPAIQEHFAARTRAVLLAPYERLIDTGEPIRYGQLSSATRDAWLKIAASVAEGL
nr:chromosome partitioning protein [Micromonospora okii]